MLLLPELGRYGHTNTDTLSLYYIIESNWRELDKYVNLGHQNHQVVVIEYNMLHYIINK